MPLIDQHFGDVFQARLFRSGAENRVGLWSNQNCDVRFVPIADIATRTPTSLWGRSEHTSAALSPKSDSDTLRVLRIGPDVWPVGKPILSRLAAF